MYKGVFLSCVKQSIRASASQAINTMLPSWSINLCDTTFQQRSPDLVWEIIKFILYKHLLDIINMLYAFPFLSLPRWQYKPNPLNSQRNVHISPRHKTCYSNIINVKCNILNCTEKQKSIQWWYKKVVWVNGGLSGYYCFSSRLAPCTLSVFPTSPATPRCTHSGCTQLFIINIWFYVFSGVVKD